jgi:ribose transport system permease protein
MTTEPVHDIDLGASSPAGALEAGADRASAGSTSLGGPALASARGTGGKTRATRRWYRWTERWAVVGCLVVVVALFSALRPSAYATFSNLQSVLTSQATLLIVALLLTVVLAVGDLDLSIGE